MYKTESSVLNMIMFQNLIHEKKAASQDQVEKPTKLFRYIVAIYIESA